MSVDFCVQIGVLQGSILLQMRFMWASYSTPLHPKPLAINLDLSTEAWGGFSKLDFRVAGPFLSEAWDFLVLESRCA